MAEQPSNAHDIDFYRRFNGVGKIYGQQALERFKQAHIVVLGLGGVGSWTVEALARSAIGHITLVDMDHVAESNINRQIQANSDTLGQSKALALQERISRINPHCHVTIVDDFISPDNQHDILTQNHDWVIDCIDSFRTKAALIAYCRRQKIKVITVGGAGGMTDASMIRVSDLSRTKQDPLLSKTRKLLRQSFNFPSNPTRRFAVPCIYSEEQLKYPDTSSGEVSFNKPDQAVGGLNCSGGFGSSVVITASMGLQAAGFVLNKLSTS